MKPDAKYSIIRPMYGDIFRLYNKAGERQVSEGDKMLKKETRENEAPDNAADFPLYL